MRMKEVLGGSPGITCLVCGASITVRMARGRKYGKPFVMLICPLDGRHFRGFITYADYVAEVLERVVALQGAEGSV